jgi:hypothetical protein
LLLVGDWNEFDTPEGWVDIKDSQLVNLGSCRFCIVVEVTPVVHDGSCSGNGKVKLHMKRHKLRYHMRNHTFICDVF